MSFRCQECKKLSQPGEKQNSIIVKKRQQSYHYYVVETYTQKDSQIIFTETKPDENDKNIKILKEFTSHGWEIVEEKKVCNQCLKQ
jgi:hypothetical protein